MKRRTSTETFPNRAYIKYAVHETMVQCSFAAVFLLKIAILFPTELPANVISLQVAELAHLLSECSAERYALTLRLMLRSFRRKMGENTMAPGTPRNGLGSSTPFGGNGLSAMTALNPAGVQSLLSNAMCGEGGGGDGNFVNAAELSAWMDDLGPFNWPEDGFSPSNLPPWIMDSVSRSSVTKHAATNSSCNRRTSRTWDFRSKDPTQSSFPRSLRTFSLARVIQIGNSVIVRNRERRLGSSVFLDLLCASGHASDCHKGTYIAWDVISVHNFGLIIHRQSMCSIKVL